MADGIAALGTPDDVLWHAPRTPSPQVESRHGDLTRPRHPRSLRRAWVVCPEGCGLAAEFPIDKVSEAQCAKRPIWGERSLSVPADFSTAGALPAGLRVPEVPQVCCPAEVRRGYASHKAVMSAPGADVREELDRRDDP